MSCAAIDQAYFVDKLLYCVGALCSWVGIDAIAYTLIALCALMLAFMFRWVARIVIPVLAGWIDRVINSRAREVFNDNSLQFEGFRFQTCVVSATLGLVFYAALKIGIHFPQYWPYSLAVVVLLVVGFTAWGIQTAPVIRLRPFVKHFYIPALSAVGLLCFNAAVDFAVALVVTLGHLVVGT